MRWRNLRRTSARVVLALAFGWGATPAAHAEGEGAFTWHPSISVTTVADDNVNLEDHDKDGSVGVWVKPRVELTYRTPAVELGADLGVDFRRYLEDQSALQTEFYRAVGWAEVGLTRNLLVRASNAYVPHPVGLGRPPDEGQNLVQSNRADVDVRWSHPLAEGRELEVGVRGTHFWTDDYTELVPLGFGNLAVDNDFRASFAQGLAFVEFQSPWGLRTSTYVRAQAHYRAFQDFSASDHMNVSLLMGARMHHWENVDIELGGGAGMLKFDGAPERLRALGKASLRWRLPQAWTLEMAAHHLNSADMIGQPVMESSAEIGVEKRFGNATAADLRVFVTRFDGDSYPDPDLFGAVELRLRRQLSRRLQVIATYRHWRNAGQLDFNDFGQNRLGLEIGFRL